MREQYREEPRMKERGEAAIFTLMMLMMSAVLVFTAVEGARIAASAFYLQMAADAAAESAFGEYCLPLWEQYRLLFFYEEAPLSGTVEDLAGVYADAGSWGAGISFLGFSNTEATADAVYLTDNGAQAFYDEAAEHARIHLPLEMLEELSAQADLMEDVEEITDLMGDLGDFSSGVIGEIEERTMQAADSGDEGDAGHLTGISSGLASQSGELLGRLDEIAGEYGLRPVSADAVELTEANAGSDTRSFPVNTLAGLAGDAYLNFFTGGADVSDAVIDSSAVISDELQDVDDGSQGASQPASSPGGRVSEWFLFREYLLDQLSGWSSVRGDHALAYEWEYLLGGKSSDRENLIYTVNRLLVFRCAVSFLEIMADEGRRAEAMSIALAICGVTGIPEAVRLVEAAIIAVWAVNDGADDVKQLLAGQKVPLLELAGYEMPLLEMDYRGYIRLLLYTRGKKLRGRALDVIQASMRQTCPSFDVRRCIYSADIVITAGSGALFTSVTDIAGSGSFGGRALSARTFYTYEAA